MANFENIKFPFELKIKKNNTANAKTFTLKSGDPNPNVLGGRLDVANMETVKVKEIWKYSNGNILWLVVDVPNANDWKNLLTQFREPATNIPVIEISYNNVGILKNDNSRGVAKFDDVIDVIPSSATTNPTASQIPSEVIDNKIENKENNPTVTKTKKSFFSPKNIFIGLIGIGVIVAALKRKKII